MHARTLQRSRAPALRNSPITTGLLFTKLDHSRGVLGKDAFLPCRRGELDHTTSWNLPASDFPLRNAPDDALVSLGYEIGRSTEGTYSPHDTALSLHELSDIIPIETAHDRAEGVSPATTDPEILVLHQAQLDPSEVQEVHGVRVTRAP